MKPSHEIVIGVVLLGTVIALAPFARQQSPEMTPAAQIRSTADFNAPLATCGTWVDVEGNGSCFPRPGVAMDWQPYCYGRWVWTDCGWYWQTDEPWGWACYHYGTWLDDPGFGWVWVPGIEWAPAWVEWRIGGGFIGWAPCAPRGVAVLPGLFAFVEVGRFLDPLHPALLQINRPTLFRETAVIRDARRATFAFGGAPRRVTFRAGPDPKTIERATGLMPPQTAIREVAERMPVPRVSPPPGPIPQRMDSRPANQHGPGDVPVGRNWFGAPERERTPAGQAGGDQADHHPPAGPPSQSGGGRSQWDGGDRGGGGGGGHGR